MITEKLLKAGALQLLKPLLSHEKRAVIKETLWLVSNIFACPREQIVQALELGFLERIVEIISEEDAKLKEEATW